MVGYCCTHGLTSNILPLILIADYLQIVALATFIPENKWNRGTTIYRQSFHAQNFMVNLKDCIIGWSFRDIFKKMLSFPVISINTNALTQSPRHRCNIEQNIWSCIYLISTLADLYEQATILSMGSLLYPLSIDCVRRL